MQLESLRKRYIILLLTILGSLTTSAQDIISFESLNNYSIALGESAKVSFNINKKTVCDSYIADIDVNYATKRIEVSVNYDYISSCNETTSSEYKYVDEQILLEGTYSVFIDLNVSSNILWNENIFLGTLVVNEPWPKTCDAATAPIYVGLCPLYGSYVCACDGQTYDNECEAYLENNRGNYVHQTCTAYAASEAEDYDCKTYNTSRSDNFLEEYECHNASLPGKEIFIAYNPPRNEAQSIQFSSTRDDVVLFLLKEDGNDLTCIAKSDADTLRHEALGSGTYYLVSDSDNSSTYEITFCTAVSTSDLSPTQQQCSISPNPARHEVHISSPDKAITALTLYSTQGEKLRHKVVNGHRYTLPTAGFIGPHILHIRYADNTSENMKIYIEQ